MHNEEKILKMIVYFFGWVPHQIWVVIGILERIWVKTENVLIFFSMSAKLRQLKVRGAK